MAGKIFLNYRRDDSIGMAGRLHDRLAQTFGRDKLFMDVDHIPAGTDFVAHLNSQVAGCDVVLVVIGSNWLGVKDESGGRRLDNPDDFVAIEIAAALARDIRVIPVLVDGARMPKASDLPDSLKSLARRQAVDVRHSHFGHDAEALVKRMREALGDDAAGPRRWRLRAAIGAAAVAALLLIGWSGYAYIEHMLVTVEQAARLREAEFKAELAKAAANAEAKAAAEMEAKRRAAEMQARAAATAEAEAKRKEDEAERQRLAKAEQERQAKAEQERQARAAAEAEAKRKAEEDRRAAEEANRKTEAERQRLGALKAEEDRRQQASSLFTTGRYHVDNGNYPEAIGYFDAVIQREPNNAIAFFYRGSAYVELGDYRREQYHYNRALEDLNEAIRLDPNNADAFCKRGYLKRKIFNDVSGSEDIAKAKRLANNSISGNSVTQCR